MAVEFEKSFLDSPNVVLIDGAWGSGKSLVAPLVSSFRGHSPFRIDHGIELLTAARSLKKISPDAYRQALISRIVESHFNNLVGREINLRPKDDSAFQHSLGWARSLRLLVGEADEEVWDLSMARGDVFVQLTHLLGLNLDLPLGVLQERIRVVGVRRNPIFMVKHWETFLEKFDRSREVTPSFRLSGVRVPFFADRWAKDWVTFTPTERAIMAIARYQEVDFSRAEDSRVLFLYFDDVVKEPKDTVSIVQAHLNGTPTRRTRNWLKKTERGSKSASNRRLRPELDAGARDQLLLEMSGRVGAKFLETLLRAELLYLKHLTRT